MKSDTFANPQRTGLKNQLFKRSGLKIVSKGVVKKQHPTGMEGMRILRKRSFYKSNTKSVRAMMGFIMWNL
jgi:hypothetical protein